MYFKLVEFISWLFSLPLSYLLKFNRTKHVVRRVIEKLTITGYQYRDWHYDERAWRTRLLRLIDRVINFPTSISYNLNWHMQLPLYKAFGGQICNYCQWWIEPGKVHQYCLDQLEKELDDDWPEDTYASDPPDESFQYTYEQACIEMGPCAYCGHPYKNHLYGGVQEPCKHRDTCGCDTFISEENHVDSDAYWDEREAERQREVEAAWTQHQLDQDRAYREAVEASWAEGEPDDAEWPDHEEEEETQWTQVWYTESPGGHNYWE